MLSENAIIARELPNVSKSSRTSLRLYTSEKCIKSRRKDDGMQLFPYLFILLRREKSQTLSNPTAPRSLVDLNVEKCFRFVSISVAGFFFFVKGGTPVRERSSIQ